MEILLLWLDEELEKYNETRQKGIGELLSKSFSDPQVSSRSHPETQPQLASQSTEIMESSPVGGLARPKEQPDKRPSVFSQAVSSLPPIPDTPLNVEMPAPVGDASDFVTQDGIVKYASFSALIGILTAPKPNPNITHFDQLHDAFLLCFRCFSTPMHVVRALVARFRQGRPNNLTSEQERVWPLHMQAVRLRVVNILRAWIDLYWVHEDDCPAAPLIQLFAESTIELRWPEASDSIVQGLKRHLRESDHPSLCRDARHPEAPNGAALGVKIVPLTRRPSAVGLLDTYATSALEASFGEDSLNSAILADDLVRNDEFAHVLVFNSDQHCTELARQLTLFMSAEFRSVNPEKLWHHLCRRCRDCHTEKTINMLLLHAAALQAWTAKSIVAQNEPETRAGVMTFLIALALRCRKLRNFGALCAIYSGLTFGFTERLSQESLPLPEATKSALQDLCHLVQEARNDFELSLDCCRPTIPPIGWFLEDFGSVNEERHHVRIPGMPKNMLKAWKSAIYSMHLWHVLAASRHGFPKPSSMSVNKTSTMCVAGWNLDVTSSNGEDLLKRKSSSKNFRSRL
ncbi:ras guanine nucleotide exchange factor domain-containing protein [Lactifluus subvellereus]|nr:ras guanine nucleotide exchange factor domain-containing protein [Lactifluus subvellereus]